MQAKSVPSARAVTHLTRDSLSPSPEREIDRFVDRIVICVRSFDDLQHELTGHECFHHKGSPMMGAAAVREQCADVTACGVSAIMIPGVMGVSARQIRHEPIPR